MIIGDRIRQLREAKKLSQGDIERRTGLLRCYLSRVENGHTVPSVETLTKLAMACEVPLYRLFCEDGTKPPAKIVLGPDIETKDSATDMMIRPFVKVLPRISDRNRKILLHVATAMTRRKKGAA